MFNEPYMHFDY